MGSASGGPILGHRLPTSLVGFSYGRERDLVHSLDSNPIHKSSMIMIQLPPKDPIPDIKIWGRRGYPSTY